MKPIRNPLPNLLIDRIRLILTEEVNKSETIDMFLEKATLRILELTQDEVNAVKEENDNASI